MITLISLPKALAMDAHPMVMRRSPFLLDNVQ